MTVSPEEIAAYFRQHPGEFTLPTQVEVSQIVLANEYKARRIYHKLNRRNFSAMAIKHSITPESATGGNLKAFSIGEVPRFFNVAFSMKVGQISDIIKSAYGFHILLLRKKRKRTQLNLADATPLIREQILRQKREKEYQKWVDMALHKVNLKAPYIKQKVNL